MSGVMSGAMTRAMSGAMIRRARTNIGEFAEQGNG
jgi:hypothetical protein